MLVGVRVLVPLGVAVLVGVVEGVGVLEAVTVVEGVLDTDRVLERETVDDGEAVTVIELVGVTLGEGVGDGQLGSPFMEIYSTSSKILLRQMVPSYTTLISLFSVAAVSKLGHPPA